ncbi:MAG: M20/M25/M40 family metallo-hydrolase [Chloroflexi bacterium]|nr:M20/M25/M40 family metallo-hydrolase [Chloroflexota bacterium]
MDNIVREALARVDEQKVTNLLCELVNIPSVTGEERECARFLTEYMASMGLEARLQEVEEGRANAIGILRGTGEGPTLMFNGHLDTAIRGDDKEDYPAMGPLSPGHKPKAYIQDGHVYGLGSYNMKGGVSAAVIAIDAVKQAGIKLKGNIVMTGVAGESETSPVEGALRSYQGARYRGGGYGSRYLMTHCLVPDYAVVCEPSGLFVVNAQNGYLFVKITVQGKVGHQSTKGPGFLGINAIEKAFAIVEGLRKWDPVYVEKHPFDSGLGTLTPHVNVGAVEGGYPYKPTYVSGICNLYVDLRVTPAMTAQEALGELEAKLREIAADDPQLKYALEVYASNIPGTVTSADHYLIQACLRAREMMIEQKQGRFPSAEASPWTDANIFRQHGIPAVMLGPGGTLEAPGSTKVFEEGQHVGIKDLVTTAKIYVALILDLCTKSRQELPR